MNRRSFLSALAAIPGLGWVKPTEREIDWPAMQAAAERFPKICSRAEAAYVLTRNGADVGAVLYGMGQDGPLGCMCDDCHSLVYGAGFRRSSRPGLLTIR